MTEDKTAPVISNMPSFQSSVEGNALNGATITYTLPTAQDIVAGAVTPVCKLPSGDALVSDVTIVPVGGPYTVTCTATDAHNNAAIGTFTVTVGEWSSFLSRTGMRAEVGWSSGVGAEATDVTAEGGCCARARTSVDCPARRHPLPPIHACHPRARQPTHASIHMLTCSLARFAGATLLSRTY